MFSEDTINLYLSISKIFIQISMTLRNDFWRGMFWLYDCLLGINRLAFQSILNLFNGSDFYDLPLVAVQKKWLPYVCVCVLFVSRSSTSIYRCLLGSFSREFCLFEWAKVIWCIDESCDSSSGTNWVNDKMYFVDKPIISCFFSCFCPSPIRNFSRLLQSKHRSA